MSKVEAMIYITGLIDILARNAPMVAKIILRAITFFAPNLSERKPIGIENKVWQRVGIAIIRPTCRLVSLNSSFRTGKRVVRMFPAA